MNEKESNLADAIVLKYSSLPKISKNYMTINSMTNNKM